MEQNLVVYPNETGITKVETMRLIFYFNEDKNIMYMKKYIYNEEIYTHTHINTHIYTHTPTHI